MPSFHSSIGAPQHDETAIAVPFVGTPSLADPISLGALALGGRRLGYGADRTVHPAIEEAALSTRLPDISEVEPIGPSDRECLEELYAVLRKHGAVDRFGINLLHDHFAVEEGEMLVETCDPAARTLTIRPASADAIPESQRLVETNWAFEEGNSSPGARLVCKVGCFMDLKDNHKRTHDKVTEPG